MSIEQGRGRGLLAIWSDISAVSETDYLHWLTREHTLERVTTEGFLSARVLRSENHDRRYVMLYELQTAAVLDGNAYLARLNAPTPWSQRIMPLLGNFVRGGGTVTASAGIGEGGYVALLRLDSVPPEFDPGALVKDDRITAVTLVVTDTARTSVTTKEKGMRKNDASFAALIIVEALDQHALAATVRKVAHLSGDAETVYRQFFANNARIAR